ncbi:MAG: hypothetical protein WDO16_16060 [Bacteroidota bacterium]
MVRLLYLVTNLPDTGIMSNWPIGRASSIVPSSPLLRCSAVFISGMRPGPGHKAKAHAEIK